MNMLQIAGERMWESMNRVEEIIATTKLNELLNKKEEEKQAKTVLWILAIIGAVAAVAADRKSVV